MSLTKHILGTRKIKVWNVFYPVKANYLKTFSHMLDPFFYSSETSLEMINNVKVQDARDFFISKKHLDLDIDRQYSYVTNQKNRLFQDNYQINQCFTSMMNSFFVDIIKKVYIAMQKHTIEMEVCLDGTQSFDLKELVKKILNDQEEFNLQ